MFKEPFYFSFPYLAGLIDADGTLYIQKNITPKNEIYPSFRISICQKYSKLLFALKKKLGFGVVYKRCVGNAWNLDLNGYKALELLKIVEPFLVTKRQQAKKILEFDLVSARGDLVSKIQEEQKYFRYGKYSKVSFLSEWFSGYFDGDGCIIFRKQSKKHGKHTIKPQLYINITINRKDKWVADWLIEKVGGVVYCTFKKNYSWVFFKYNELNTFLQQIVNFTNVKRIQIQFALKFFSKFGKGINNEITKKEAEYFFRKMKRLKRRDNVLYLSY